MKEIELVHHRCTNLQHREKLLFLICRSLRKKMVEYALAGMDNQLFVSTYMLQLPDRKTLEEFLLKQLGEQINC